MIWFFRLFFFAVLITMLCVTSWASHLVALWKTPREVVMHPWFIATLFDTYFAFFTIWLWVAYKESCFIARGFWLVAIFLLGNIAISIYLLIELFRLPTTASFSQLLLRRAEKV